MCKLSSVPDHYIYWVGVLSNFFNVFLGIVIVIFASMNHSYYDSYEGSILSVTAIDLLTLVLGVFIIVGGVVGIVVLALWKWKYLVIHAICLAALAIILFSAGLYYFITFDKGIHAHDTETRMKHSFDNMEFLAFNSSGVDGIQKGFQCCGLLSWKDYKQDNWMEIPVPRSCCKNNTDEQVSCNREKLDEDTRWNDGCLWKVMVFSFLATTELRLFLTCSSLPVLQTAVLSGILAHFVRHRYL